MAEFDFSTSVFDFSAPAKEETGKPVEPAVTYTAFVSNEDTASVEKPIFVLKDPDRCLANHQNGIFLNPKRRTAFEYEKGDGSSSVDISEIDSRFIQFIMWLGENTVTVRLHGRHTGRGYCVYRIRAVDYHGKSNKPSERDGLVQLAVKRLLASRAPEEEPEFDEIPDAEPLTLQDLRSMEDFLACAGGSLPLTIRNWAYRQIDLIKSGTISLDEKMHAQRSLSLMLNIQWKGAYFESIDPVEARRILDEELYGLEKVKQRVIETIIQINRTHTLPAYGLLLCGPAGTGKSQIAYAVARILKLPWTALDMSAIHDSEQLTGSPRVYSNAKPGRIMEAFSQAEASNLVFIINELDKADSNSTNGNPADALLTLLDNLGYTDNYVECVIPTGGVYPIATANDKSRISDPLMTRFAVIDIEDYTSEEKKTIFLHFSLPRVLKRMSMNPDECVIPPEAAEVVVEKYKKQPGCRDLEQAAEHLAANALYRIETQGVTSVTFDAETVRRILD